VRLKEQGPVNPLRPHVKSPNPMMIRTPIDLRRKIVCRFHSIDGPPASESPPAPLRHPALEPLGTDALLAGPLWPPERGKSVEIACPAPICKNILIFRKKAKITL